MKNDPSHFGRNYTVHLEVLGPKQFYHQYYQSQIAITNKTQIFT